MVKSQSRASLDDIFGALADPTRRAIVARLSQGDATVSQLAQPFDVSLPAVTKHLVVLERAGLLLRRKEGRVRRCTLVVTPMATAQDWLATYGAFWNRRFDALTRHVERRARKR